MGNKNEVKLIVTADTKGAVAAINTFGAQLKSHWLELSAMAAGAFFTIKKLYNEFAAAAEREEKRMAFTNLAATFHSNADSIIADLKRMSGQSITTSRAIELAAKPMLSGLDPRAMPGLMEFAKTMTNVTGGKAADTFEDFTRAIITGNTMMLRRQGIDIDFNKAEKDLAESLGGTVEQLNEQHTQYARLIAFQETASTMTQRLGKDNQTMADDYDKLAATISDSWEEIKDGLFKAFGPVAREVLRGFAENLRWINWYIDSVKGGINYIVDSYNKVKGLIVGAEDFQPPSPANELTGAHRGATSLKNLGFTFDEHLGPGLQSLKDYTEEMKGSLGELAKSEKDLTKEATNQIRDREAAYKNMYEALKFDTEKYYTYQKGLLEKQRDEEIAITGDLSLAWEAYYARLEALEEQRILRTDDFMGGIKAYYAQLEREGITWAEGAKSMMEDVQGGMASSIKGFLTSTYKDSENFLENLGDSIVDFLDSVVDAMSSMYSQMVAKGIMSFAGNFFNFSGFTKTPQTGVMVHDGGYIDKFHGGGLAHDEVPAVLQRGEYVVSRRGVAALDRINRGESGRSAVNVAINVDNQTGRQVDVQQKSSRFDGEKYVVNVILKDLNSNGQLRTAFAGIK